MQVKHEKEKISSIVYFDNTRTGCCFRYVGAIVAAIAVIAVAAIWMKSLRKQASFEETAACEVQECFVSRCVKTNEEK